VKANIAADAPHGRTNAANTHSLGNGSRVQLGVDRRAAADADLDRIANDSVRELDLPDGNLDAPAMT
jgi:hypothetical protein